MITIVNRGGNRVLVNTKDISTIAELTDNSTKNKFCVVSFISSIDGELYTNEDFDDIEYKIRLDS